MHRRILLTFAWLFTPVLFLPYANAQSTSLGLGARMTASTGEVANLVAVSGDTAAAWGVYGDNLARAVYVFQRRPGGWTSETETSTLTPSDGDGSFGASLAMSGDTVVVGAAGKVYVFVKPAAGWKSMHEVAQLTVPNGVTDYFGQFVAIDGDTIVAGNVYTAYVFVMPAGGWVTTSTFQAQLTPPTTSFLSSLALNGNTVVLGYISDNAQNNVGDAYVFQQPQAGWSTPGQLVARLTRANPTANDFFGQSVAVSGDTIAVGTQFAQNQNGTEGVVDLFVEPETGWADATETVELYPPHTSNPADLLGTSLAIDSSHVVAGSGTDQMLVYSKPAAGWAFSAWPSQELIGTTNTGFGGFVAIDGDTVVTSAPRERRNNQEQGAAYVFTLEPNWITVSTDLLEFPDMNLGGSEVSPLTVTNVASGTLTFTTKINSPNYQVLQTAENTCAAGVPAGQSCILPIQFNPPAAGQHTNTLILSSPSSASIRIVELRGVAAGVGAASEIPLNFPTITHGTTTTLPLVITNYGIPGSPTIAASFSNPSFSLVPGGTCSTGVANGKTCTLMIQFAPASTTGYQTGIITLTPSSGAASTVNVTGYAQ
jgi:FG-GAP repeat